MSGRRTWDHVLRILFAAGSRSATGRRGSQVVCPHCTNLDTLTLRCPDDRCGWARCSCGALIYDDRRHRHPRHRSEADTCHDPGAAV